MSFAFSKFLLILLLPPASLLALIIGGLLLLRLHRTAGRALIAAGIALLYFLSLEPVADRLIRPLESVSATLEGDGINADAVVVLGGGVNDLSWVRTRPEPSPASLQRLVEGIRLARAVRAPLILSGGSGAIAPTAVREADAMAELAIRLGYPGKDLMIENRSRNTWENAEQVKALIPGRTIVLVTSAFHLRRSSDMFRKQGFSVIPAPTGYRSATRPFSADAFIPRAAALDTSSTALAEYASLFWYRLTGKL